MMVSRILVRLATLCALIGIVLGCDSVFTHILGQASQGGQRSSSSTDTLSGSIEGGFEDADSEFSDAPVSPGGTGGVVEDDPSLVGEETRSFFTAFQVDPLPEDSAGPKFVLAADMDNDGMMDLVSAWQQSQPIQLHLQRRDADNNVIFRTINLGGTAPIAVIAGLEVGYIHDNTKDADQDDWLDVVVLSKSSGNVGICPSNPPTVISRLEGEIVVLFSPGNVDQITDGDAWTEMILVNPLIRDRWVHNQFPGNETVELDVFKTNPERAGFTSLAVGDITGDGNDDIVVALNPGECEELGQKPPVNTVDLWVNPGMALSMTASAWGAPPDINMSRGVPIALMASAGPEVTDVTIADMDGDGDLDVLAAWFDALSLNVRWVRNPLIPHNAGGPGGVAEVIAGFSEAGEDICLGGANDEQPCPNGDVDCAGVPDGSCVGGACQGGSHDGSTCAADGDCLGTSDGVCFPRSWRFHASGWEQRARPVGQVDTNANVMTLGDIDGDGLDDVLVRSTPGEIVQWFRHPNDDDIAGTIDEPEFPPSTPNPDRETVPDRANFPWPVYTVTEFQDSEPEGIAIGDVTGDGQVEIIIAAEGAVFWYDGTTTGSIFDAWSPNTIIQDSPVTADDPAAGGGLVSTLLGSGVGVDAVDTTTVINAIIVTDLDGDGKNDIVATLDRRSGPGLSDDRLVWYKNTHTDEP